MGNDQTTLKQTYTNRLNISKFVQISAEHNKKVYHKNLKPFKQFASIIKSIHVRSTYLQYDWAQWLCTQLSKDPYKVYQRYCEQFKLNLMKKNEASQCFHLKNLFAKFLSSFGKTAKSLQTTDFSHAQLAKLFQEAKCYFMVQNWFSDLPLNYNFRSHQATISFCSKQNSHNDKQLQLLSPEKCKTPQIQSVSQNIYRILLKLTEIYFSNNYFEQELKNVTNEQQSKKINSMQNFNAKEVSLIKRISKQPNFKQRQFLITKLLNSILKVQQTQNHKVQITTVQHIKLVALANVLGIKNVYCVLKVLTEVGSTDNIEKIQSVFNHMSETIFEPCQNRKKVSPEMLKTTYSPQKKKISQCNKIPGKSIR